MCGRISQHCPKIAYVLEMEWDIDDFGEVGGGRVPNWNVPPSSHSWLMHRVGDSKPHIDIIEVQARS